MPIHPDDFRAKGRDSKPTPIITFTTLKTACVTVLPCDTREDVHVAREGCQSLGVMHIDTIMHSCHCEHEWRNQQVLVAIAARICVDIVHRTDLGSGRGTLHMREIAG